jgi:NAD/NADP transhydrogenase alpha subunit
VVGGFVVTDRMLEMFKAKPGERTANAQATKPDDAGSPPGGGGAA